MEEEKIVARADIKAWRTFKGGRLDVKPPYILIYAPKGRFMRGLELMGHFEIGRVKECALAESDMSIALEVEDAREGKSTEKVFFLDLEEARRVHALLTDMLEPLKAQSQSQDEQEAALTIALQEQAQQQQQAYLSAVWSTAGSLWELGRSLYRMVNSVRIGSWPESRNQYTAAWRHAERLALNSESDVLKSLEDVGESLARESGEQVVRRAASFLDIATGHLLAGSLSMPEWQLAKAETGISPSLDHLPYFWLFSALYGEISLSVEMADWPLVEQGLANLKFIAPVLSECFGISADTHIGNLIEAAEKKDSAAFLQTAKRLEASIEDALKKQLPARGFVEPHVAYAIPSSGDSVRGGK